ncbi:RNA-guided endonuclease InsQ/TnpB family protein [Clostridiisalibacter paucivorans]|uniref:RNA-guided endonuclease InsQ/TnpB family protein n=1 Tax=Clostridiisalibacter paucivorans TaxID=408753 RepID=UPI0012ECB5E8|nr:RNA-guided endonuclease TnpB family protein [Clostridiisalibacter paucivorans]
MMTKSVKIKLGTPIDSNWNTVRKILADLRYNSSKMLNFSIQQCYQWMIYRNEYREKYGKYPRAKDIYGYSHRNHIYRQAAEIFPIFNRGNISQTVGMATSRWSSDQKDVMSLRKSIPSYRLQAPIYIANQSYTISRTENGLVVDCSLVSKKYAKEETNDKTRYRISLVVKDNSTETILDRIVSGEYSQGYGQIVKDRRKEKWYLLVAYRFEPKKTKETGRILGIDLGIVYPLYMALNDSHHRYRIDGGEIEHFRRNIEKRKNQLLDQGKYCGDGRRGHGIRTRIAPIEFAREKIKNFRNTTNHKYSKFVVDIAQKHDVETIQLEKLDGISEDSTFLKNWSYYDLQQKIQYKAQEKGIKVAYIDPRYTSQRCSRCGNISRENRQDQQRFRCTKCGFSANADYNAAKNISTQNIEKIIEEELKK